MPTRQPQPYNRLSENKTADKVRLDQGRLYDGTVTKVYKDSQSVHVVVDHSGLGVANCKIAIGIFAAFMGFRTSWMPPTGTRVKIAYGNPSFIVAVMPSELPDGSTAAETHILSGLTGTKVSDLNTFAGTGGVLHRGHTPPADMLEGEFQIANQLGVALTLLTTISRLSASDRAYIETHLLNGMVRIVSQTFRNFSSFGLEEIYNDGRLNARWDGTSYEHEALGNLKQRDEKISVKNNVVDFTSVDAIKDTGRWRFSRYLGFLGDIVHVMVTDPTSVLGSIAQDAIRSGKADFHVGADGAILVQSVTEIAFERVCRIPVPVEVKRQDDPAGTRKKDFDDLERAYLKIWDFGTDLKNIAHCGYQLREYSRWLGRFHSLARFHQVSNWQVPSETETPAPDWLCVEDDKTEANAQLTQTHYDTYACFRLMRDGSIITMGGMGESCEMVKGSVRLASPRHLYLEAAGDIDVRCGGNLNITARRSIAITSIAGGIILKSRAWLRALCEWGSIWIKSDAKDPTTPGYTAKTNDDLTWGAEDPLPVVLEQAVLIEATNGHATVHGKTRASLIATGPIGEDSNNPQGEVSIESVFSNARLVGNHQAEVRATTGNLELYSGKDFLLRAQRAIWNLTSRFFDISRAFTLRPGFLSVLDLRAAVISATGNILGPKFPGPSSRGVHYNHIAKIPENNHDGTNPRDPKFATDADNIGDLDAYIALPKQPVPAFVNQRPIWDYEAAALYQHNEVDSIFQSLPQQHIVNDTANLSIYGSVSWDSQTMLKKDDANNGNNLPAPGKGAQQLEHTGGDSLNKPSSKTGLNLNTQTKLQPKPITFKYLKKT